MSNCDIPGGLFSGKQDVFAELKVSNIESWEHTTDVIVDAGKSCFWKTHLSGLLDLSNPERNFLKIRAKARSDGKVIFIGLAQVSSAAIKTGNGEWVELNGKLMVDEVTESGSYTISARYRKEGTDDVWEDVITRLQHTEPSTKLQGAEPGGFEAEDDNYGKSDFEIEEASTQSKKSNGPLNIAPSVNTGEDDEGYADEDFEQMTNGSVEKPSKSNDSPAPVEMKPLDGEEDEYADDNYEEDNYEDDFA